MPTPHPDSTGDRAAQPRPSPVRDRAAQPRPSPIGDRAAQPLRRHAFRWFFAGRLVSLLGSSMAPVALAFAVLDASGRPGDLGVVLAARMIPGLAFLMVGGAVADRLPRRAVLVAVNLGAALTQGTVAAVLLTGRYTLLAVAGLEFANGALDAFTSPALRGVVPELVGRDELRAANSLLASTRNATKILGPTVAGLLVAAAGSGPAIAFDAATYLAAALCLGRLTLAPTTPTPTASTPTASTPTAPTPTAPTPTAPAAARTTLVSDIRTGWAEFRRIPWVWPVSLAACVMNLALTGAWQILGPTLASEEHGPAAWGYVLSARGLGLLAMSVVMYRLAARHLLRLGSMASVVVSLPLVLLGLGADPLWVVAGAFVAGLGSSVFGIAWDTSMQEHVPGGVLSRVSSWDDLLSYVAIPAGQLSIGPLTAAYGGHRVAAVAGGLCALACLAPLASRAVRRLPHGPAARQPSGAPAASPVATTNHGGSP